MISPTTSTYVEARDLYLSHVSACQACARNHHASLPNGHLARLKHWTLWRECPTARALLAQIEGML